MGVVRVRERDILGRLPTPLGMLKNDVLLCGEPYGGLPVLHGTAKRPQRALERNAFVGACTGKEVTVVGADRTC
jgi:hypothetical protein